MHWLQRVDVCPYNVIIDPIRMPPREQRRGLRAFIRMHPTTAENLGLKNGDTVCVESVRGAIDGLYLELSDDIDPRVVWASDGWWLENGDMNTLTDDRHTAFGHTPGFNSVLVRIRQSKTYN